MTGGRGFKDHFSGHASVYAAHRPTYPAALFAWLAEQAPARTLAWDAGTGNGQAAAALAEWFEAVIGTDASREQLAAARPRARVTLRVGGEAGSGLADGQADLVTVAQALHWFDRDRFWAEVRRVLKPGGLVAVWCYSMCRTSPEIDAVVDRFYEDVVGPYWPPERTLIEGGYVGMDFPFARIETPELAMTLDLDLDGICGYVSTWSAYRRYLSARDEDPLPALRAELAAVWGTGRHTVTWPLSIHAGRPAG